MILSTGNDFAEVVEGSLAVELARLSCHFPQEMA
jgi:hypothetical protein